MLKPQKRIKCHPYIDQLFHAPQLIISLEIACGKEWPEKKLKKTQFPP